MSVCSIIGKEPSQVPCLSSFRTAPPKPLRTCLPPSTQKTECKCQRADRVGHRHSGMRSPTSLADRRLKKRDRARPRSQKPDPCVPCAHGGLEIPGTNERLGPQNCTAAAADFAGGPVQIRSDERGGSQRAAGPAAGRGAGESAQPETSPPAPGGPWAREMGRRVSSGGREMRCRS